MWQEMTRGLLDDLLTPATSIDGCAKQIANFPQNGAETVSAYAMRLRTILSQFQAAVDRVDDKRTTWSTMLCGECALPHAQRQTRYLVERCN